MTKNKKIFLFFALLLTLLYVPQTSIAKSSRVLNASQKTPVRVTDIRYWSNPAYTRVVINLSSDAVFKHRLLKEDPGLKKPRRLYVDISRAAISPSLKQPIPINDGLLRMARAGQYTRDTVRVVLDIESIEDYKIFDGRAVQDSDRCDGETRSQKSGVRSQETANTR